MAAVLLMKGLSPGAALVFLIAAPVTSIATMTVIGKAMGKRILIIYIANIVINALLFGMVVDYLIPQSWLDISILSHNMLCASNIENISLFKSLCSIALIGLIINAYVQKYFVSKKKKESCCCKS